MSVKSINFGVLAHYFFLDFISAADSTYLFPVWSSSVGGSLTTFSFMHVSSAKLFRSINGCVGRYCQVLLSLSFHPEQLLTHLDLLLRLIMK